MASPASRARNLWHIARIGKNLLEWRKITNFVIRWLGAFGDEYIVTHVDSFRVSMKYELETSEERCAELCSNKKVGVKAPAGLVYGKEDCRRFFPKDTWSVKRDNGTLKRGNMNHDSDHSEIFLRKGAKPACLVYKRRHCKSSIVTELKRIGKEAGILVYEWNQLPNCFSVEHLDDLCESWDWREIYG